MSDTPQASVPAGWYSDPSVAGQVRWWDGAAWTSHVGVAAPQPPGHSVPDSPSVQRPVPTDSTTAAVWILATTPLWIVVGELLVLLASGSLTTGNFSLDFTGGLTAVCVGVALAVILIVATVRDASRLRVLGFDRPPSPAWILLTPLAYLVVRAVRVHERIGRGAAPLVFFLVSGFALGVAGGVAGIALPAYLVQHGGTSESANATSFATGVARGLASSGKRFDVTCTPFSTPTTTPVSIICDATDGTGADHKMVIEVYPATDPGAAPTFRLVSVSPPISR